MTVRVQSKPARSLSARERLELILHQLDQLPTLSAVAVRLLALTTSENASARDIVRLIESDASLTAAVLRLVGRADVAIRGEDVTVERAVTLLGFNTVRNVVLSVQLFEALPHADANRRAAEVRAGIWQHSLAVACVAEEIARQVMGPTSRGIAFVCGLLHDIGKVALDACLPKSYARVIDRVERGRTCICDVERAVFGLDHTVAGKHLVTRWKLPSQVIESVWMHHQSPQTIPSFATYGQLLRVVHLADDLVRREGIGYSGYQHIGDTETLARQIGLDVGMTAAILESIPERLAPFRDLFTLDEEENRAEYTRSVAAANRSLAQLNAKLGAVNRRLEVRSQCLSALERFSSRLSERDGVGDVCVAAADCVRFMLEAPAVVVFFADGPSRCVHVAASSQGGEKQTSSMIDLGDTEEDVTLSALGLRRVGQGETFQSAPLAGDLLWERCLGMPASAPLWMLLLSAEGQACGAVLVAATEASVAPFQSAAAECTALSTAIGLAMRGARARLEAERMSEELLDLNRRLEAAQKEFVRTRSISMIAAMAAGAAHELNNPLSVVSGRAQMELARCENEEAAKTYRIIIEQTQRATQIVSDLMRFAKPEPPTRVLLPLKEVLERLSQHWREKSSLREEQFTVHLADETITVYADGNQLREMLNAVIANAVGATDPPSAHIEINSPSRSSDETVRVVISDNGVGMPRDVLEHALDPFFSSRPAGRGRGLGLSHAYRLAEIHGGRLLLDSTPNAGTTVTIELPAGVGSEWETPFGTTKP